MKVAITADVHLTTRKENPERFHALIQILRDAKNKGISHLIIAGDLFDASRQNYNEFEAICQRVKDSGMQFTIIPGNHDPAINNQTIVGDNVNIISTPTLQEIEGRTFLFIPYRHKGTMGDVLAEFADKLPPDKWILVGHGDWSDSWRMPNPTEPGVYIPLTRRDISAYRPARVFLGHIHRFLDQPPVHYVGSPCGLDITETGRRRYLIYETESNLVVSQTIDTEVIYFNEQFVILPGQDELAYLEQQITSKIQAWYLNPSEQERARIRIRVQGYSTNRKAIKNLLDEAFQGFRFYKDEEPDISEVSSVTDPERDYLAQAVLAKLETLSWPFGKDEPGQDKVVLAALHLLYGGA